MKRIVQQITLRGPSAELTRRLKRLSEERGKSLNSTVLELLEQAVGIDQRRERLARYMTWSDGDRREFERALSAQRVIDDAAWK